MNNDKTCRTCLEDQIPMISIYQPCADIDEIVTIDVLLRNLGKIEVEIDDGLPDKICKICLEELKRTCRFITQIQDSDKTLRSVEVLDISINKSENFMQEYIDAEFENKNFTELKLNPVSGKLEIDNKIKSDEDEQDYSMGSCRSDEVDDPSKIKSEDKLEMQEYIDAEFENKNCIKLKLNPLSGKLEIANEINSGEHEQDSMGSCRSDEEVDDSSEIKSEDKLEMQEYKDAEFENKNFIELKLNPLSGKLEIDGKIKSGADEYEEECSMECNRSDEEVDDPSEIKSENKLKIVPGTLIGREHGYSKLDSNNGIAKRYRCNFCSEEFSLRKDVIMHRLRDHQFEYKCKECNKSFPGKMHLKVHQRSHFTNEQKPYVCSTCNARFAYKYLLTRHSYRHTEKKPFPCPHCDKGCITAVSFKQHLKTHDTTNKRKNHMCKICDKGYRYHSGLVEHMKNHTGEKPFLCSRCGKDFRQKGALMYHIRSHDEVRPFKCELCNNTFVSAGILKVHMRRHTDERPYVCDLCGKGFRQSSDCKMHRRTHLGIKLNECNICHKKMSTTGQLTIHKRMHTGERPFSCPHCYKRFSTRSMLAKHNRVHTGERPYICSECGKAFSQNSTLSSHMKMHARAKEKEGNVKPIVIVVKAD